MWKLSKQRSNATILLGTFYSVGFATAWDRQNCSKEGGILRSTIRTRTLPNKNIKRQEHSSRTLSYANLESDHGLFTFKIKKSLMISLVMVRARYTIKGTAANQVNMKLYGSESSKMYVISKPVMSSRKKNLKVHINWKKTDRLDRVYVRKTGEKEAVGVWRGGS